MKIKHYVLCCFFLVPLFCFSQTEEKPKYAPSKEKHKNKLDELGRKQEVWNTYNIYGEKVSEVEWKDDQKNGSEKKFYPFSKVKEEIEWLAGRKDGPYAKYYYSGETAIEGQYLDGKKDGKWTAFFSDGTIRSEGNYKENKRDGEWKFYNRKGNLINSITYKDGVDVQMAAEDQKKAEQKKLEDQKKEDQKKADQKKLTPGNTPAPVDTTKK